MRRHADPSRGLPCSSRHLGGAVERLDGLHRRSSFVWAEARAKLGAQADTLGVAPGAIAEQRMRVAVGERRGFSGSRLWPLPNAAHGRRVRRITEQRRGRLPMPWRSREPSLHVEHHHPIRELWMSVMNGASGSSVLPAGRWSVDATRSSVAFAAGHMTLATVNGRFQEFDGALEIGSGTPRATLREWSGPPRSIRMSRYAPSICGARETSSTPASCLAGTTPWPLRGRRYARGQHRADRVT
jgi:hypothetical protein